MKAVKVVGCWSTSSTLRFGPCLTNNLEPKKPMSSLPSSTKVVRFEKFGRPTEVVSVADEPLPSLGPDDVLVKMVAAPINPSDINTLEGKYGILPSLPAVAGLEGAGRIVAMGNNVTGLEIGRHVRPPSGIGTWREAFVVKAAGIVTLPSGLRDEDAAMLRVNPPTAWRLLEDFATLDQGDWIVQNGASSAVGRLVIQLARARNLRTLNLVRRQEVVEELRALGADEVMVEDESLPALLENLKTGIHPKLGLNCIGGESALRVANILASHGTHVTYGAMSRQPFKVPTGLLIFKDLRVRGFWLTAWLKEAAPQEAQRMFESLAQLFRDAKLSIPVAQTYSLLEAKIAIKHAFEGPRNGKILFKM